MKLTIAKLFFCNFIKLLFAENEETPVGIKQSGNAKVTFNDTDYFKLKRILDNKGLGGSSSKLALGGPLYEDVRIVEGQVDEQDPNLSGIVIYLDRHLIS